MFTELSHTVCNQRVAKAIEIAQELEEDDDLHDYVLGAAVEAVRQYTWWNADLCLEDDDALSALCQLFDLEKSDVFTGEREAKVLNDEEWEAHVQRIREKYPYWE